MITKKMSVVASILTTALTVVASTLLVAPAHARTVVADVRVSAGDVHQGTYDCPCPGTTLDFAVNTSDDLAYVYYTYEVKVTDPRGEYHKDFSSDWEFMSGTWQWPVSLNPSWNAYGTYTVTATVKFYTDAGNVPDDIKIATTTFEFSGPDAPPEEPPHEVQIQGKVFSADYTKVIRYFSAVVQSEYRTPASDEIGIPVQWKLLVDGRVVRTLSQTWRKTGTLSVTLPQKKRARVYEVRITANEKTVLKRNCAVSGRR